MSGKVVMLAVFAALLILAGCTKEPEQGGSGGAADTVKSQTICPVMGGKINRNIYADHDGKRVYFCCEGCIDPFKKNPAQYIKKLEDEGVEIEKAP